MDPSQKTPMTRSHIADGPRTYAKAMQAIWDVQSPTDRRYVDGCANDRHMERITHICVGSRLLTRVCSITKTSTSDNSDSRLPLRKWYYSPFHNIDTNVKLQVPLTSKIIKWIWNESEECVCTTNFRHITSNTYQHTNELSLTFSSRVYGHIDTRVLISYNIDRVRARRPVSKICPS